MCVRQHLQSILILTTWGKHLRPEPEIELGCHQIAYTSITAPTSPSAQPGLLEDTEAALLTTSQDGLHLPLASTDRGQTVRLSANGSSITRPEGQQMQKFHHAIPLTLRLTEPQLEVSSHLKYGSLLQDIERHLTKEEENLGILSLMWRPTMKREIAVRFQYAVLSWRPSENKIKWPVAGSDVITEEERRRKFKYSLVDSPIERPHNGKFH